MRARSLLLCVPATILLLLAIPLFILLWNFDRIFMMLLAKNMVISPTSPMFKNWIKPTVPIFFNVTLFNITNAEDILDYGVRPILQEVGPFVYRESRERFDVEFFDNNTVKYKHRIFYHFDRNLSLDDPNNIKINTPDLFFLALIARGDYWRYGHEPFIELTAEQVMWGYEPTAVQLARAFGLGTDRKVGLFASNNGTNVNEYLVDTGASDIQDIGRIQLVDGQHVMNIWHYDEANMINGTDGSLAPPGLDVNSTIQFHVPDICRSSTMYGVERRRTINRDDIEVIAFTGSPPDASNPLAKWRTEMFCDPKDGCPLKGLIALEQCIARKGANLPMFMSMPFFMRGDPRLREPFDGLPEPDPELHETWVHIEPTTGAILEAFKRVQFSVFMENTESGFGEMKGPYYFPIAWLSETAVADKATLSMLSSKVFSPRQKLPLYIAIVSATLLFLSLLLYLLLFICLRRSIRAGKRINVVSPATSPMGKDDTSLNNKLGPWTPLDSGDCTQVPEAKPLLQKTETDLSPLSV